ncbi:MAG: 2-iminoacetate synthase ThiH [Verrucomicrobiae bacterium]|nr:2-iminoacetate synthase ThiH [Verrucomicrobiae bacterium]NNJ87192.1 2-iminoacetate synthase ThiH [Akkermansiaceae bacterium]
MSFVDTFNAGKQSALLEKLKDLLAPKSPEELEAMAQRSRVITQRYYGKTMRLFAPLYVSNECVNNCSYCGFSRDNPILRTTLTVEQVVTEARHLHDIGFRNLLLVAGEHPKFVSDGYLQQCIDAIREFIPTIGIEVGPMEDHQYAELVQHGAEGLVVYQETYDRDTYTSLHTAGPKKNFDWRLECPERAYAGGFRRIGIGALFGLADWKSEALALASHLEYLYKNCWKASFTVSFPRMRPYAGNYQYKPNPDLFLNDRHFVQLVCAFRLCFPHVGIVVSTREPANLRDALVPLGVTHMSAEARTDPGGYTGAGTDDLHLTVKGKRVEIEEKPTCNRATEQFKIDDQRGMQEVASMLQNKGYESVWKDWDREILSTKS